MEILFHADAVKRFNDLGADLRGRVRVIKSSPPVSTSSYSPHPVGRIDPGDVIGPIATAGRICDGLGNEVGRVWRMGNGSVGLIDDAYQEAKKIASALEKTGPLRGRVQVQFLVDEICLWLQGLLEQGSGESLVAYLSRRCEQAIRDYEIWVPLFRVHGRATFSIGEVAFRNISSPMMERFFTQQGKPPLPEAARHHQERLRSQLQDHLAACVTVTAEKKAAQAFARARAEDAIAMLRFLSPANWVLGMQSYCLPLGRERIEIPVELTVEDGAIREISRAAIENGPVFWDLDADSARFPKLLDLLHALASDHANDFRQQLYDALLLYSRNSITLNPADKLVFVLVSLESLLLRDSNEPITKNIAERIAFLIGTSVDDRRRIIKDVDETYRLRSKFIHHGRSIEESEVVERFLEHAWHSFHAMLQYIDSVPTKAALLEALENRKLS